MLAHALTGSVRGVDAFLVTVEVALASALPSFSIVGLAQGSVREGRERVAAALRSSGYGLPNRRITVNLAPGDVRKEGTAFDLPIAVAVLAASGAVPDSALTGTAFLGELGLDGGLRPVPGVLPVVLEARRGGLDTVIVPADNAAEAALVTGITVLGADTLCAVVKHLRGESPLPAARRARSVVVEGGAREPDLADVRGQEAARRALEIAAAGAHNLLLVGPPGAGKTMLARRLPGILPPLGFDEAIEVATIHSVAGHLTRSSPVLTRPFRAPHHSVSYAGLVGGGNPVRPGEASLAHRGVLFLDELPEFRRNALEVLRQPLEEGAIALSRAGGTVAFPADFRLVAAMNPCPCGHHGSGDNRCRCDPVAVARYAGRVSGPLLDRIDLRVEVPALSVDEMLPVGRPVGGRESSAQVRARVTRAWSRREARAVRVRGHELPRLRSPNQVSDRALSVGVGPEGIALLRRAVQLHGFSARGCDRVIRVARTIADLAGSEEVEARHVGEALQYRTLEFVRPPV